MKPFRMKIRLYNNRLVRAREELGLTQSAAAAAIGISVHTLLHLEILQKKAWKEGGWSEMAIKIADFYGHSPEYLWPDEIRLVRKNALQLELAARDVGILVDGELERRELAAQVEGALRRLAPDDRRLLEESVLEERTLGELGNEFPGIQNGKSPERTRQRITQIKDLFRRGFDGKRSTGNDG